MKIKIIDIQFLKKNEIIVDFSSSIGEGRALWKSIDKVFKGKEIQVELDVPGILIFGQDIVWTDEQEEKIYVSNDLVIIRGKIEQIEWDNIITVRLGAWILLVEVEDKDKYELNKWIEIKTRELELTEVIY